MAKAKDELMQPLRANTCALPAPESSLLPTLSRAKELLIAAIFIVVAATQALAVQYATSQPKPFSFGISTATVAFISTLMSALYVFTADDAEEDARQITMHNTARFAPIGIAYGISDLLVYIAIRDLSASSYTVLRQIKLPLAALLSIALLGRSISFTRQVLLGQLTLLVTVFQWEAHGRSETIRSRDLLSGAGATVAGALLNCLASLFSEYLWRDRSFPMITSWIMYLPFNGVFGLLYALIFECQVIDQGIFSGWTHATCMAAAAYCAKGWVQSVCTKYLGTLARSLCSSAAVVVVYAISMPLGFSQFDPLEVFLGVSIACCVFVYEQRK